MFGIEWFQWTGASSSLVNTPTVGANQLLGKQEVGVSRQIHVAFSFVIKDLTPLLENLLLIVRGKLNKYTRCHACPYA